MRVARAGERQPRRPDWLTCYTAFYEQAGLVAIMIKDRSVSGDTFVVIYPVFSIKALREGRVTISLSGLITN